MSEQEEDIGTPEERAAIEAALDEGRDGEAERLLDAMLDRDDPPLHRPGGPAMSGDTRALIERARREHTRYAGGDWCRCGFPLPCTTARLAEALAELHDHLQPASDEIRELAADRDAVLERAERLAEWEKLGEYLHHWHPCDSMALGPDGKLPADCSCGLRLKLSAALGLAAPQEAT